jgi:hypothetical protein
MSTIVRLGRLQSVGATATDKGVDCHSFDFVFGLAPASKRDDLPPKPVPLVMLVRRPVTYTPFSGHLGVGFPGSSGCFSSLYFDPRDLEFTTLEWVYWFNNRRMFGAIGCVPPAEHEASGYSSQVPARAGTQQTESP